MPKRRTDPAALTFAGRPITAEQYQVISWAYSSGLNRRETTDLLRAHQIPLRREVMLAAYAQVAGVYESGRALNRQPLALQPSMAHFQQVPNRMEQPFRVSGHITFRDEQGNITNTFHGYHSFNRLTSLREIRSALYNKIMINVAGSPPSGQEAEFAFATAEFDPTKEWML